MNQNPYILMWLESPMQSWGSDSRYGRRSTLDFPTKSGVLGIVCNALGAQGEQRELLAEFAELDMQVIACPRLIGDTVQSLPVLKDFHMVGSGYNEKDKWEVLHIPKTSDGKKAVGGGSKMTYRHYLQDMAFAVLIQVPIERVEHVAGSLVTPVYDLALGRKCCVPTEFIYQGTFDSIDFASDKVALLAEAKNRVCAFTVLNGEHDGGEIFSVNDVPIQFGEHKKYRDRMVTVVCA